MVSPRAISSSSIKFAIISSTSIFPRWLTSSIRPVISTRRSLFAVTSSIIIIASFSAEFIPCSSSVIFVVAVSHGRCQKGRNRGHFLTLQEQNKDGEHVVLELPRMLSNPRMLSPVLCDLQRLHVGSTNLGGYLGGREKRKVCVPNDGNIFTYIDSRP